MTDQVVVNGKSQKAEILTVQKTIDDNTAKVPDVKDKLDSRLNNRYATDVRAQEHTQACHGQLRTYSKQDILPLDYPDSVFGFHREDISRATVLCPGERFKVLVSQAEWQPPRPVTCSERDTELRSSAPVAEASATLPAKIAGSEDKPT
ncbi:hypothetical protein CMUS01_15477 [Colletotrichum musicola]|uniref:Uncharacterized protein n=1 Tax=Colletotrichum musicola TaxID=2175873 RepID=A0A8H6MN09_9PEZI|nr:hypothetical protein CMUS01_15477 [Colletotrichum musicola]